MIVRLLALLLLALPWPLPALAQPAAGAGVVEGRDYVVIADGRPWQAQPGKIELVEVFAYTCGHCADLQPQLEAWLRRAPADVAMVFLPAAFDPADPWARAHFAAQALGVDRKLHGRIFAAVHRDYTLPARGTSPGELAHWFGQQGVDREAFLAAMTSADTDAKMAAARDFAIRSGVRGTPVLIVEGRYRVQGRTLADTLRIAEALIARERAAR